MDIQLDQKDFQETVTNNKTVVIDFYADWCGPCQTLLPTVHKLADEFKEDIVIKKVNVDANEELATQFGVRSIPTLIFLNDGVEVERQNGLISEEQLRIQLETLKIA